MKLHIDLCTGVGGWKAPFEESDQWRSVGIDIRDDLDADVIADVRQLPINATPDLQALEGPRPERDRRPVGMPPADRVESKRNLLAVTERRVFSTAFRHHDHLQDHD